jgi:nucleoside-diphosphate-sugar epimerase
MAYGHGSVYGVTKVIGEDLCRTYQHITGGSFVMLRYHEFIPRPYLEFGARLLRNGVDRRDIASATVASLRAAASRKVDLFRTIVHTQHGMPKEVVEDFRTLGPDWCEEQVPGAKGLLEKYGIPLPERVEQHDLSEAERVLGWRPSVRFTDFLNDLKGRDARGEDVRALRVPSELPS